MSELLPLTFVGGYNSTGDSRASDRPIRFPSKLTFQISFGICTQFVVAVGGGTLDIEGVAEPSKTVTIMVSVDSHIRSAAACPYNHKIILFFPHSTFMSACSCPWTSKRGVGAGKPVNWSVVWFHYSCNIDQNICLRAASN